ncbi:MAG: glycine--tRNA ligase subunit beta [Dokdonella sp.]
MVDSKSLLIELGCEELPPKALADLANAFAAGVCDGLNKRGIAADIAASNIYCTPRRLAMRIPNVVTAQPDQLQERRGPALSAAIDANGQPTKALLGFAQSCGVNVDALEKLETDKGAWFVHRAEKKGQPTSVLIPEVIEEALKALPIPKPMRWGNHDYSFVRPVHWLVILHGEDIVPAAIMGLTAGRESRGHRFHHPEPVTLARADVDHYVEALRSAKVLVSSWERREKIRDICRSEATSVDPDLRAQHSDELLDELAALTEWPVAILCAFDKEFLEIPHEALTTTMVVNQRFVPTRHQSHPQFPSITRFFIGIANIESHDPAQIRQGYERVIRPRFADAKFFYDEDRKQPLSAYRESLKSVTYQQSLGSVWDKSVRVAELARVIANRLRDLGSDVDSALATRAAELSKCDLMTRMVGEFPELQGSMGGRYALQGEQPENKEVANAIYNFYRPRFAGEAIAEGTLAQVLSVAERLDTLVGIFAVGMKPSGNKDPFALRRAALGLARTLIEGDLDLDLKAHITEALELIPETALVAGKPKSKDGKSPAFDAGQRRTELAEDVHEFILDRLKGYYADQEIGSEAFEAVRVLPPSSLVDFDRRLRAVVLFARLPEAQALAAANKRIGNILRQAEGEMNGTIDPGLLEQGAESVLATAVSAAEGAVAPLSAEGDYVAVLQRLAELRGPVDDYFDKVMVMSEDAALRRNRLALLRRVRALFLQVADISSLLRL